MYPTQVSLQIISLHDSGWACHNRHAQGIIKRKTMKDQSFFFFFFFLGIIVRLQIYVQISKRAERKGRTYFTSSAENDKISKGMHAQRSKQEHRCASGGGEHAVDHGPDASVLDGAIAAAGARIAELREGWGIGGEGLVSGIWSNERGRESGFVDDDTRGDGVGARGEGSDAAGERGDVGCGGEEEVAGGAKEEVAGGRGGGRGRCAAVEAGDALGVLAVVLDDVGAAAVVLGLGDADAQVVEVVEDVGGAKQGLAEEEVAAGVVTCVGDAELADLGARVVLLPVALAVVDWAGHF